MSELKPFASLSASLLARKGQAKPAMRPQAYGAMSVHDDLGWNDMGYPANHPAGPVDAPQMVPPVVAQQAALAEEMNAEPEVQTAERDAHPAEVVPILRAAKGGLLARAKAAFTLRLDPERHLKLRLACAVDHRSAQQIVTQALDEYLNAMPEIDVLAGKVPARGKH